MMELLRSRRSIRRFTGERIEPAESALLEEAVLRSPSSRGIRPWRFQFIDDPALIHRLAGVRTHGSGFAAEAPLLVVICARESESDVWVEDCSIAAVILHLAAHSLGLGSCWIQIRNRFADEKRRETSEQAVRRILGLTGGLRVEAMIAIGRPAEDRPGVPVDSLDRDRITWHHARVPHLDLRVILTHRMGAYPPWTDLQS